MSKTKAAKETFSKYIKNYFDIRKVTNLHIYTEKIGKIKRKDFFEEYITSGFLRDSGIIEYTDGLTSKEVKNFVDNCVDYVERFIYNEGKAKYSMPKEIEFPEGEIDRESLIPIIDLKTAKRRVFNTITRTISLVSYEAWEAKISKEERKFIPQLLRDVVFKYDPYNLENASLTDFEEMKTVKINLYKPPKWRLLPPPEKIECPSEIWKVYTHLFPDKDCLDYILHWTYTTLLHRNETYLVLNGIKGLGKGIFCSILAALVGREHFTAAPSSFLDSNFNATLDQKRLIQLDEFIVGKKEHTRLKRYINKFQNIERKGIDVDKETETYNSFVICNNDVSDMYLETDDRRFSVPDLSEEPLLSVMSKEEIEKLVHDLEHDEDLIYRFGYFIYNRCRKEKYDEFSFWSGKRFWEICYTSLSEWKRYIVDKILAKEEECYHLKHLSREFMKDANKKFLTFPRNYSRVSDFLKNYRHEGKYILGELVKIEGQWNIIPSDEFMPEKIYDNEGDEDLL